MKKQINATGVNGTFTGWVEVELNDVRYFGHDNHHRIVGIVNDVQVTSRFVKTNIIWQILDDVERVVTECLRVFADSGKENNEESIESQLKAKGFI